MTTLFISNGRQLLQPLILQQKADSRHLLQQFWCYRSLATVGLLRRIRGRWKREKWQHEKGQRENDKGAAAQQCVAFLSSVPIPAPMPTAIQPCNFDGLALSFLAFSVASRIQRRTVRMLRRKPVNSLDGQLVTAIFQWRADRYVFRVVWRIDCRYSSHEWACLLTKTVVTCKIKHLQKCFSVLLYM